MHQLETPLTSHVEHIRAWVYPNHRLLGRCGSVKLGQLLRQHYRHVCRTRCHVHNAISGFQLTHTKCIKDTGKEKKKNVGIRISDFPLPSVGVDPRYLGTWLLTNTRVPSRSTYNTEGNRISTGNICCRSMPEGTRSPEQRGNEVIPRQKSFAVDDERTTRVTWFSESPMLHLLVYVKLA